MGAFCYQRGLQTRILRNSKEHRNKIHLCICKIDIDILDTEIRELVQKEDVEYVPLNEIENVHFGSITTDNILRDNVSFGSGDRFANSGENIQINNFSPDNDLSKSSNSQRFSSPFRENVILLRNNSQCQIIHENCSNTSVKILETSFSESGIQSPNYCTSKKPSKMVVKSNQHNKGEIIETLGNHATMTTDALTSVGWGGHLGTQIAQGTLNLSEKKLHINCLEMEAVIRTIKHFLSQLKGKNVLIRCDNSTVVQYINQVADFLTGLFTSGLQYRTIAGYRSMLSTVLPPIEKIPVGQHPYIIRLLKGVFNSRPPKIKLLSDWDLLKVLEIRCSDLHALRIGDGNISVHSTGVFFIREGLSKQDRPGHVCSKIFVPSFKDNKLLNPKRSLCYYLKMTDNFCNCDRSNSNLFLSVNSQHNPVSSQTISNWIVQTIQMAYNEKNKSAEAHSTRATGPSWAPFKCSSMKSIMEAADWSREYTFTKLYLRNLEPSVLS
ncbi:unnamed protein product [Mytilus coruscus]|uniref:RNase H type-1 domain-containing protein n=1 Tax=Mytilus coruscus TaxID=42192 RepID=A0A6J8CK79_MYTCO|nr:unnamed protein product [Mytilus coruscus]